MFNVSDDDVQIKNINQMEVIKRDGRHEKVSFDKITSRISGMCKKLRLTRVDPIKVAIETIEGMYNGITTEKLDLFAANKCAERILDDPEYNILGAGICVSNIHKTTSDDFMEITMKLYYNVDRAGRLNPLVTNEYVNIVKNNITRIQASLDYERDYLFDFFSVKTMEKAYLIRLLNEKIKSDAEDTDTTNQTKKKTKQESKKETINLENEIMMRRKYGRIVERPQHMFMRVAIGIHMSDIDGAFETYNLMSNKYFTHASPTLYNAGTKYPQLSSCFLLNMSDSIDGIFETVTDVAKISKRAGGIGITLSNIRAKGSLIRGTNGNSDGIIPLAKLLNQEARYVNQGGRRKGAIALYIEPWHADVYEFCELRKNTGAEELRARDIFMALWIPDLFMKRVSEGGNWSLMCPDECPGLTTSYGEEFEKLYERYESEGRARRVVKADDLLFHIMEAQIETGMPYMSYKDNVNHKSNQKNVGVVQCSNLCVSGDTKILTDKGHKTIEDLVDQMINVWNGEEWSETTVVQTGVNQDLVAVELSNGVTIKCTPYHKFYVDYYGVVEKRASELKPGHKLIDYKLPPIIGHVDNHEFTNVHMPFNERVTWLDALITKHGYKKGNTIIFKADRADLNDDLPKLRLMLQTFGINTVINHLKTLGYYLSLDSWDVDHLRSIGCLFSKFDITLEEFPSDKSIKVTSVTKLDKKEDTFCFEEPKRHMGIFNGVLTGQCSEIVEYTSKDEIAVCNLASICLHQFIDTIETKDGEPKLVYNYQKLYEVAKVATRNLNKIIDINHYPVEKAKRSNLKHRPIGVGVQGLADVYCIFGLPFDSEEAQIINKKIFETIYFGCCEASMELSKIYGPYESYEGSPFSKGQLQWHLWGLTRDDLLMDWDWSGLIGNIMKYGMRNSLLTALMPTASTSQIMMSNECHEPYTSNLYTRSTLAGEFIVVNRHLIETLIKEGLWTEELKEELLHDGGSIQKIQEIPDHIKRIYKTAFEMKTRPILDQSIGRGPFIDQTQSLNLFSNNPNFNMLRMTHIYGWKKGLKTGLYYLRSKPAVNALDFGLEYDAIRRIKLKRGEEISNEYDDHNGQNKDDESGWKDPRKESEIETSNKIVDRRGSNYADCEMCSG